LAANSATKTNPATVRDWCERGERFRNVNTFQFGCSCNQFSRFWRQHARNIEQSSIGGRGLRPNGATSNGAQNESSGGSNSKGGNLSLQGVQLQLNFTDGSGQTVPVQTRVLIRTRRRL
jgi:hypothetical protein